MEAISENGLNATPFPGSAVDLLGNFSYAWPMEGTGGAIDL